MSFWFEQHRPLLLKELCYNDDITQQLSSLAKSSDVPHLCIYGPSGAGRMTRIRAFLRELYEDDSVNTLRIEEKAFQTPSGKNIDVTVYTSPHHMEINPSDVGIYDRVVVQEIIKDAAQSQQVAFMTSKTVRAFKVVVIVEADRLTKDAQHALRRTMEKYTCNLRIILCCSGLSRVIPPIRSRCLLLRIPAPSDEDIQRICSSVAKGHNVPVSANLIQEITASANGNLRRALLLLEASSCGVDGGANFKPDWKLTIETIAGVINRDQTPNGLLQVRCKIYELLTHCIPASTIMRELVIELLKTIEGQKEHEVLTQAAIYEHRMILGSKTAFHIEAFVARTMAIVAAK